MVTDAQVRLLRKKVAEGKTLTTAAAAAGMSERSARTWKTGPLPSETKEPRAWRTREDPYSSAWASPVTPSTTTREAGCASPAEYFQKQFAGEVETMFKITDGIVKQIDPDTGQPRPKS